MAGYEWSWTFFLNRTARGRFTVSCKQRVNEDAAHRIAAKQSLRDGAEIYGALSQLMLEAGYELGDHDLSAIAEKIGEVSASVVDEFVRGEAILSLREEENEARRATDRSEKLRPFRACIDAFAQRFSEAPRRYGSSERGAAIQFIEQFVIANGHLPDGVHRIQYSGPTSYSGGACDFSELSQAFNAVSEKPNR